MVALRATELLAGHGDELRGALEEAGEVVKDFQAEVASPLRHHSHEAILDVLLVGLDFVDDLGRILLLDLRRGGQQALNVVEDGSFEELRPRGPLGLFFHLVGQVFKCVQQHRENVLHRQLHEWLLEKLG